MQKKRSGEGGFTLVELLIVIVILGILGTVVVLAIGGLRGTAQNAVCDAGAKTIATAEEAYYADPAGGDGSYGDGAAISSYVKGGVDASLFTVTATGGGTGYSIAGTAGGKCATMATVTG